MCVFQFSSHFLVNAPSGIICFERAIFSFFTVKKTPQAMILIHKISINIGILFMTMLFNVGGNVNLD